MAFAYKALDFTFNLGSGTFDGGEQTIKITGLRASVNINVSLNGDTAECTIYGLTKSQMNRLSTLGRQFLGEPDQQNIVIIEGGDKGGAMSVVYEGPISQGYADYNNAPDNPFVFSAVVGMPERLKAVAPNSFPGTSDVATILSSIAVQMNRNFENNGVSVQISNAYLHGPVWQQARSIAKAANINLYVDGDTLAIWPLGGSRNDSGVTISPSTGMHGYPSFTQQGILVACEYNPGIKCGQTITVQSDLTPACGKWTAYSLSHTLESETPNGRWMTTVQANNVGQ